MTNLFHDCLKLTIAIDQKLKDQREREKLETARDSIISIINKNFPEMKEEYYTKIIS